MSVFATQSTMMAWSSGVRSLALGRIIGVRTRPALSSSRAIQPLLQDEQTILSLRSNAGPLNLRVVRSPSVKICVEFLEARTLRSHLGQTCS